MFPFSRASYESIAGVILADYSVFLCCENELLDSVYFAILQLHLMGNKARVLT